MNRKPPTRALVAMVATTVALAGVAFLASAPDWPSRAVWFWMIACTLSERLWVRLPFGRATLSMSSCFNLAALLVLPRGEAMFVVAVSVAIAERAFMRKPATRVVFNGAQTALAVAAGSLAFTLSGGTPERLGTMIAAFAWWPFLAAGLAYSIVNTGAVSVAVALSEGTSPWRAWRENFWSGFELVARGALLSLGILVAIDYMLVGPAGTILAALSLILAHRSYARRLDHADSAAAERPARAA